MIVTRPTVWVVMCETKEHDYHVHRVVCACSTKELADEAVAELTADVAWFQKRAQYMTLTQQREYAMEFSDHELTPETTYFAQEVRFDWPLLQPRRCP